MESFLDSLKSTLYLNDSQVNEYVAALQPCIMEQYIHDGAMLLPSYIYSRPSGDEVGEFVAIELGGTMLRVAVISLSGPAAKPQIKRNKSWLIPQDLKSSASGRRLFNWIAQSISEVLGLQSNGKWRAGLTFSFPVQETSIATGQIMLMGKGFTSADGETQCIKVCLSEAMKAIGLDLELCAILNDSIATLLAQAYLFPMRTSLSLILGTGCNSASFASSSLLQTKLKGRNLPSNQDVVAINCELSMFGKELLPWTKYDFEIDQASIHPGYQPLEQFTSGMYLGELVRRIWLDVPGRTASSCPTGFEEPFGLSGTTLSSIESDTSSELRAGQKLLNATHPLPEAWATKDVSCLRSIALLVSDRSATLIAGSLIALGNALGAFDEDSSIVPCCGAVLEHHTNYLERCQAHLDRLRPGVTLQVVQDGGQIGAAVLASMQQLQSRQN